MSASVINFTPKAELTCHDNMLAWIKVCRQSAVFNANVQFDQDVWRVGHLKGKSANLNIVFNTLEASKAKKPKPTPTLPEPFISFAKACLVYMQDRRGVKTPALRTASLRYLEASLRQLNRDARPTAVDVQVLDAAVALAVEKNGYGYAYGIAGGLQAIADLMQDLRIIKLRGRWRHGLKPPPQHRSRISAEALEARQKKLPSAAGLRAVAGIFNEAQGVADNIVASYCALMLCAPERVNEVLRLEVRCLVEGDGRFSGRLGMRWPGSKLSADTTKWLPSNMVSTAREAVARLTQSSAAGRNVAAWYTANPGKLFLHEGVQHLRTAGQVTAEQVGLILWGHAGRRIQATTWLAAQEIEPVERSKKPYLYSLADVESAVLRMLPSTFPFVPGGEELRCMDSLALVLRSELDRKRSPWQCMFQTVDQNDLNFRLRGHEATESIFERYGYTEDDGTPIEISTHAFRHYLNMLGQVGGLSDVEIAIFSGRKDIKQNRAYDHRTSIEVQAPIVRATKAGFRGALTAPVGRELLKREELLASGRPASHTTPYGYCLLDFAAEPCARHRDCVDCDEQECVKGESHKERNLRLLRDETVQALARARAALEEEEYGADEWVKHHTRKLSRADELLAIIDDPHVPAGARIRLVAGGAPQISAAPLAQLPPP